MQLLTLAVVVPLVLALGLIEHRYFWRNHIALWPDGDDDDNDQA